MTNNIKPQYFSQVRDFLCRDENIPDSELDKITKHLALKKYAKGEYILNQGETETFMSYIIEGKVHQYSIIDSKEVTERVSLSGSAFCSYISYTAQIPSNQIHQAFSNTLLVRISKQKIESLLRSCPHLCFTMLRKIENIHLQREIRAFILQHRSALKRYELFLEMEPMSYEYQLQVPQKYIASYIGLTPQAYSKAKKTFLRKSNF